MLVLSQSEQALLLELARASVENCVQNKPFPSCLEERAVDSSSLQQAAGLFVTLRNPDGELRGCIGTIFPETATLHSEIRRNAIRSATQDPRFARVEPRETELLTYEISILEPPEPVDCQADLDPDRFGVILTADSGRRGVMLPSVAGLDTVEQQLSAVRRKAGIPLDDNVRMERFRVLKVTERDLGE